MPDTAAEGLNRAPLGDIIFILLRHFRDALADAGLTLDADEARELAGAIADRRLHPKSQAVTETVAARVDSCLAELQSRWQLDFAASLRADMTAIGPWRSTAEFLELANVKAEAETDIALGSALLVAGGRREYARYLLDALEHDAGAVDIDAVIARRVLLHISGVDVADADGLPQLRRWLADQPPR